MEVSVIDNQLQTTDKVVTCIATKKPIYKVDKVGHNVIIDSFGFCETCKNPFHVSYLIFAEGTDKDCWAIQHCGRYCKDCWAKEEN